MKFQDFTRKVINEVKEEVEEIEKDIENEIDKLEGKEPSLVNTEADAKDDVNKDKTITLGQPSGE